MFVVDEVDGPALAKSLDVEARSEEQTMEKDMLDESRANVWI